MNATRTLHELGQSLWLDNITRNLLRTGVLRRYIDELAVTGLTSNPTIFDHAIKNSKDYDDAIKRKLAQGESGEKLFFDLALEDVTEAADLFRPVYDQTCGVDGWGIAGSLAAGARHRIDGCRGQGSARSGATSQSPD
jgi:transaldolase